MLVTVVEEETEDDVDDVVEDELLEGVTTTTGVFFDEEEVLLELSGRVSIVGSEPWSVSPLPYFMPRLALNVEIIVLNVLLSGTVSL